MWSSVTGVAFICAFICVSSSFRDYATELHEAAKTPKATVKILPTATNTHLFRVDVDNSVKLVIGCYAPGSHQRSLLSLWRTVSFYVKSTMDSSLYHGNNATDVYQQFSESSYLLNWFLPWSVDYISVAPFDKSCIGVKLPPEPKNFDVQVIVKAVNPWLVLCFSAGLVLFLLARRLSTNIMFYYGTGVMFGLLASLLIVLFIVSRFIPKKSAAYAVLGFGFSITAWLLQYLWQNIQQVFESYSYWIAIYFAVAGLVSFAVCYYRGPVTNPRLLDLIKWSIQLVAVLMIYWSCQIAEIVFTVIGGLVLLSCLGAVTLPARIPTFGPFAAIGRFWQRRFPPKIRLLTEDEYIQQGIDETRKALEDLQKYCRSPDCNAWKTLSRVSSPVEFAKWVEGSSEHIADAASREYFLNPSPRISLDYETDDEED